MKQEKDLIRVFIEGAISPEFIAESIASYQSETDLGAHDIFLGQVRADVIEDRRIVAIDYTAYEEMALTKFREICSGTIKKFQIKKLEIFHSLGVVKAGEICLLVIASAPHRKEVFKALQHAVEEIKVQVPVFGREIFEDDSYQWKVNT